MQQGTGRYGRLAVGRPTNVARDVRASILIGLAPYGVRVRCGCGCGFTAHNCRDWQTRAARNGHGAEVFRVVPVAVPGEPRAVRVPCACGMETAASPQPGALRAWREHVDAMMRREVAAMLAARPRDPMRGTLRPRDCQ